MVSQQVIGVVAKNWWALLIRGLAAIVFGILAFIWPVSTIVAIGFLFGIYALVDGIFAIVATIRAAETGQRWWPLMLEGIIGIIIAGITFWDIRVTLFALYLLIAAWAFMTGFLELAAAIQLRKHISNEFWLIVGGLASILFGVLLIWRPLAGALALVWIIGAYAIVFGVMMVALSFRLRAHAQ
jgi:uncharacterized membrane protein HdeD (DUF308 family)